MFQTKKKGLQKEEVCQRGPSCDLAMADAEAGLAAEKAAEAKV